MPIVYGSLLSPYVRKVLMTLQLKNIQYDFQELHPLKDTDKQKLKQLNPLGKIPVYQEDDFIISDSSVICAYLDKKYPQHNIIPNSPQLLANSLWYEEYSDTKLTPAIVTIFVNKITKLKLNLPPDDNAIKHGLEIELPEIFNYLDQAIASKKYFINESISIADISIASAFMSYKLLKLNMDESRWKHLTQYLNFIFEEPIINQLFAQTNISFQEKYGHSDKVDTVPI
jgi:glutathione S-transferase